MPDKIIIVADSGSTKTDWLVIKDSLSCENVSTIGLNPYFTDKETTFSVITKEILPLTNPLLVDRIEFYGAGCASDTNKIKIKTIFSSVFQNANVKVCTDILGAAKGLFGNNEGIACILGTGANSCYYNGRDIIKNNQSLGFILGDEGSGAYLGKSIVKAFLTDGLPFELKLSFLKKYSITRDSIIENVYNKPNPNAYLATYCEFLSENINDKYIQEIIKKSFRKFVKYNILNYENYMNIPIGFVGSIAFYFREILNEVLAEYQLTSHRIIKSPIDGLKEFYA